MPNELIWILVSGWQLPPGWYQRLSCRRANPKNTKGSPRCLPNRKLYQNSA